ncbi:flippase [Aromatoleum petrolei]|uniref:Oligosaccharide flippase family protein n=1 Tax=Aromatoleum petrolei TaxID=76116 RepID=A0ABX1MKG6_9RHOO|nr:flippase [Aromatoleum petrolei]NMF88459.1 oligosaccharide flippase family protein [Aromatoleum petrolei]QTQ36966.1 Putative polysaccharide biosynthesis protein [Aromatoleum petrolei]
MRSSVGRNAAWNVAGIAVPSIAGIVAVPLLLTGLGGARLGVFTLAIGLIGFAGVFDLGLGRALTQLVASEHGRGAVPSDLATLARRALRMLLALGVFWAAVLWVGTPMLVGRVFEFEEFVGREAVDGLRWVAVSLPAALVTTGLVGCLEGFQRFAVVNCVRLFLGSASFLLPAVTAVLTQRLDLALASLAAVRIVALLPWLLLARPHLRCGGKQCTPDGAMRRLMRFGAWFTISSIVGPVMVFADRFYLASVLPPAAVALYTVPLDAVSRLAALPMGAINAAFPELAKRSGARTSSADLVRRAAMSMTLLWFPLVAIPVLLAEELLTVWLNASMASEGKDVARWLLLGVFLNGYAHIPYAVLQSSGRSDVTAKLHLLELPFYVLLLVLAVAQFGIVGAAVAWCLRIVLDTGLLFVTAARLEPACRAVLRETGMHVAGGVGLLTACLLDIPSEMRWLLAVVMAILLAEMLRRFGRQKPCVESGRVDHRLD